MCDAFEQNGVMWSGRLRQRQRKIKKKLVAKRGGAVSTTTPTPTMVECAGCHNIVHRMYTDVDHRRPRFLNGSNHANNLQRLCVFCHRSKTCFEQVFLRDHKRRLTQYFKQHLLTSTAVELTERDPSRLAARALGSCIRGVDVLKAKAHMHRHFASSIADRRSAVRKGAFELAPSPPKSKEQSPEQPQPMKTKVRWSSLDERLLMRLLFGDSARKNNEHSPTLRCGWEEAVLQFNITASQKRSVFELKQKAGELLLLRAEK